MECNCKWTEVVLAIIVIVFSVLVSTSWSKWIVFIAAVVLLFHAFGCKNCATCMPEAKKSIAKKKK